MSQPLEALALANERRFAQVEVRRRINRQPRVAGERIVARELLDPSEPTMRLRYLLASPTRRGKLHTEKLLRRCGMGNRERISDLSERERAVLASAVLDGYRTRNIVVDRRGFPRVAA